MMEKWISWPDKAGWWWNCTDGICKIYLFEYSERLDMFTFETGDAGHDKYLREFEWEPNWKYQEEPDLP